MMGKKRFFNIVPSIVLTLGFIFLVVVFSITSIVAFIDGFMARFIGFLIGALVTLAIGFVVIPICCWKYYIISEDSISVGGLFRPRVTLLIKDVDSVSESTMIVYEFTRNVTSNAFIFKSKNIRVVLPQDDSTKELFEKINRALKASPDEK